MKYHCEVCNSDMCFDGTTDKTLRYDVACHEMGDFHVRNRNEVLNKNVS